MAATIEPTPALPAAELPVTAQLAHRIVNLDLADIPERVREIARQCVLDWIAVTLAGTKEPLSRILRDDALAEGGHATATLVGHRGRVSPRRAALVNGAASHALDFDDVNFAMSGHPTVTVLPGLLALAEARRIGGSQVMIAFVAGYETACRVGAMVNPSHYARGFHSTGTLGSLGAAAACAKLLALDWQQTAYALGIAATEAAGLKSMFGTMCKPLHAGKAAENGVLAAILAERGFTARADAIECPQGFAATLTESAYPEAALAEPPGGFHILANLFKYHAACYLTHAPIECAASIRGASTFDLAKIRHVNLRLDAGASRVCNITAPRNGLEAKFSLRLTTAFSLAGLDTADLTTYSEASAADPVLTALRDKVEIEFVPNWPHTLAEMTVAMADGTRLTGRHDSGVPAEHLGHQRVRLETKFHSLVAPILSPRRSGRLAEMALGIDRLNDIRPLLALCATDSPAA